MLTKKKFFVINLIGSLIFFYDLYFIMRRGMLSPAQKKALGKVQKKILEMASKVKFQSELSVFLPTDQQNIIRGFPKMLADELNRQLAGI